MNRFSARVKDVVGSRATDNLFLARFTFAPDSEMRPRSEARGLHHGRQPTVRPPEEHRQGRRPHHGLRQTGRKLAVVSRHGH